jgi:hypothetical protein
MEKSAEAQEKKGDRETPLPAKSAEVVASKGDKGSGARKGRDGLAAANHKTEGRTAAVGGVRLGTGWLGLRVGREHKDVC